MTILSHWRPSVAVARSSPRAMSTPAPPPSQDVPFDPPALTVPAMRKHRSVIELEFAGLKANLPAALVASARGEPGARAALSALRRQVQDLEFEIDRNIDAVGLAEQDDVAAHAAWRKAVHDLPPAEAIAGIGRDVCPRRCLRGVAYGCVLGGGCTDASASCWHPVTQGDIFHNDDAGRKMFPFRFHERASRVFDAACEKLKLKGRFV
ncbi:MULTISPECIES: hypothetical protein [unclassified Bradyrhizobium]|uniref:hypothetical protein n=1 Tax=unclassified Bradyrhizobium TaxID=2631580 RepID=UPI001FF86474|nr:MULTISPECIES: hypothetical protein [unclassified Bradyrhizobium]MCK1707625.1 hypothetical protein [Bradyrhizobium sp. 143]MCK1724836.1 hypothetical protein [Bradyrhizobium sp. 142]